MARKRFKQRQMARMVYQDKDHRDIIMNEEYANAIFIGVENAPAWRQCKHRMLYGYQQALYDPKHSSINENYDIAVDIDNKYVSFNSTYSYYGVTSLWEYSFYKPHGKNWSLSYGGECASNNGHDYLTVYYDVDPRDGSDLYRGSYMSGNDYIMCLYQSTDSTNTMKVRAYQLTALGHREEIKDKNGNVVRIAIGHTAKLISQYSYVPCKNATYIYQITPYFQGVSENGIFVKYQEVKKNSTDKYVEYLYNLTASGAQLLNTFEATSSTRTEDQAVFCKGGVIQFQDKYVVIRVHNSSRYVSSSLRTQGAFCYWAYKSDPYTWYQSIAIPSERYVGNGIEGVYVTTNGKLYLYAQNVASSKAYCRVFKTTDLSSWEEVEMPDYFDVDILENDGTHGDIQDSQYKKVRFVVDARKTIPTDADTINIPFFPYSGYLESGTAGGTTANSSSTTNFGLMYVDGKPKDESPYEFMSYAYNIGYNPYQYIFYYLDNMEGKESSGNFAFQLSTDFYHTTPEIVQDKDYTVTGK